MTSVISANSNVVAETSANTEPEPKDTIDERPDQEEVLQDEGDKPDPIIEAIKTNGRLFVRNLPYTATEDDLREHFQPFGALEEVRLEISYFLFGLFSFMMNIQIGTAYAYACDVNWTNILVDASCFLIIKDITIFYWNILRVVVADIKIHRSICHSMLQRRAKASCLCSIATLPQLPRHITTSTGSLSRGDFYTSCLLQGNEKRC